MFVERFDGFVVFKFVYVDGVIYGRCGEFCGVLLVYIKCGCGVECELLFYVVCFRVLYDSRFVYGIVE